MKVVPFAPDDLRVAAIIPCHNEETAIAGVVEGIRKAVPGTEIYVYDNLSTDATVSEARNAGAIVRYENVKGKGNVLRRAFADIEADVYLVIDGDGTYDTSAAPRLIEALLDGPNDHVLGVRSRVTPTAYRRGHEAGNRLFNRLVTVIFGAIVHDMLSGYRVFSRRFVKTFPAVARAFETETELTIHAVTLRVPQTEVSVGFVDRPPGAMSKLSTFRDGLHILRTIVQLTRRERPLLFHSVAAVGFGLLMIAVAIPVIVDYVNTGLVPRFPSAILAAALGLASMMTFFQGLTASSLKRNKDESMRLSYLAHDPPPYVPRTHDAEMD